MASNKDKWVCLFNSVLNKYEIEIDVNFLYSTEFMPKKIIKWSPGKIENQKVNWISNSSSVGVLSMYRYKLYHGRFKQTLV